LDCSLPVFGKAAASAKPCELALEHPAARENEEASRRVGSPHDLERELSQWHKRLAEFVSSITAICEAMFQAGEAATYSPKNKWRAITVLNGGGAPKRGQVDASEKESFQVYCGPFFQRYDTP
jgi:hypothetical protein